MKILCIAPERSVAQTAATILARTAPDLGVSWVARLQDGAHWIFSNLDVVGVILDARLGRQACASFLKHLRTRGLDISAVIVAGEDSDVSIESVGLSAGDFVLKQQALSSELPLVVKHLLGRVRPPEDTSATLALKVAELQTQLQRAEQDRAAEAAAAADQIAQRSHAFSASLTEVIQSRDSLERRLQETTTAHERARQERDGLEQRLTETKRQLADVAERARGDRINAGERQAALEARIASEVDGRLAVQQRVAHVEALLEAAEARHAEELTKAADRLAQRETEFGTRIQDETERRRALEQKIANAHIARRDAEARHAGEVASLVAQFAERQTRLEAELNHAATARDALDVEAAAQREALERLGQRATDLNALLAQSTAACEALEHERDALEQRLAETNRQLADAAARARDERITAGEKQTALEARIASEVDGRLAVQERVAQVEALLEAAEARHAEELTKAADRLAQRELEFDTQLHDETERRRALEEKIADAHVARRDAEARHAGEVASLVTQFTERHTRLEADLRQVSTARDVVDAQAAAQRDAIERLQEESQSKTSIIDRLTHREMELNALLAQSSAACETLEQECAAVEASLQAAEERATQQQLTAMDRHAELEARLAFEQGRQESLARELEDVCGRLERAAQSADAEKERFEAHPLPLCRCTRDGVLTHANRAFAAMAGCPAADASRTIETATRLFESSNDLRWILEHSPAFGAAPTIESTWRKVDGTRLVVRLWPLASSDAIDIVAEDITPYRALQDKLARAQRMEAVGRLASEVAATCSSLLEDVSEDSQRWLPMLEQNRALRQHGERLLAEVTRAVSFLRQLADYGDEQASALEPVDLHSVLYDLKPVLKEVAGDDIEVKLPERLPRELPPFNVDLRMERVERLLVNVASYSRQRMPSGGTMIFDLAATEVDRHFIEKHPNVREGPHVVLTVTEAADAGDRVAPAGLRDLIAQVSHPSALPENPGVDLSALQGLVRECGGHLWMEAVPPGDMMIKIHLPLRAA